MRSNSFQPHFCAFWFSRLPKPRGHYPLFEDGVEDFPILEEVLENKDKYQIQIL